MFMYIYKMLFWYIIKPFNKIKNNIHRKIIFFEDVFKNFTKIINANNLFEIHNLINYYWTLLLYNYKIN